MRENSEYSSQLNQFRLREISPGNFFCLRPKANLRRNIQLKKVDRVEFHQILNRIYSTLNTFSELIVYRRRRRPV